MGSSSNGGVPPGFRFHPTDEELLHYYLRKKVSFQKFDLEVIREVDLNKIEPWDLQEKCRIGSTPQNDWYFFSHKDRKYPTGSRTNRATSAGFWKATGRDKCIRNSFKKIGMRKTLVFYRGRAPHGQKTDWIMHEYRLEDSNDPSNSNEDGWVVCRVFKKKNLFKLSEGSSSTSNNMSTALAQQQLNQQTTRNNIINTTHQYLHPVLQQQQQQSSCFDLYNNKLDLYNTSFNSADHHQYSNLQPVAQALLPQLLPDHRECDDASYHACEGAGGVLDSTTTCTEPAQVQQGLNDWAMLDRLVSTSTTTSAAPVVHDLGHHQDHQESSSAGSKGVVRFVTDHHANINASSSVNQMNQQLSLRGVMDFWAYAK